MFSRLFSQLDLVPGSGRLPMSHFVDQVFFVNLAVIRFLQADFAQISFFTSRSRQSARAAHACHA